MGRRRKAREIALQILFQIEFNEGDLDLMLDHYWAFKSVEKDVENYSRWLVKKVVEHREDLDQIIQSMSENWRLPRMAVIDRNILRLAVYELRFEENIAPAIIINEAIEIAKKFSGAQAATFINGILDAIKRRTEEEKKENPRRTNE
jgi:N utilization substance protein B